MAWDPAAGLFPILVSAVLGYKAEMTDKTSLEKGDDGPALTAKPTRPSLPSLKGNCRSNQS